MRVIVTGGRRFRDAYVAHRALDTCKPTVVVQGGANGADRLAREWARIHKVPCITFHANWSVAGAKAGPIRNSEMIAAGADLVLAFPGGYGTADCVKKARAAGIEVRTVEAMCSDCY